MDIFLYNGVYHDGSGGIADNINWIDWNTAKDLLYSWTPPLYRMLAEKWGLGWTGPFILFFATFLLLWGIFYLGINRAFSSSSSNDSSKNLHILISGSLALLGAYFGGGYFGMVISQASAVTGTALSILILMAIAVVVGAPLVKDVLAQHLGVGGTVIFLISIGIAVLFAFYYITGNWQFAISTAVAFMGFFLLILAISKLREENSESREEKNAKE